MIINFHSVMISYTIPCFTNSFIQYHLQEIKTLKKKKKEKFNAYNLFGILVPDPSKRDYNKFKTKYFDKDLNLLVRWKFFWVEFDNSNNIAHIIIHHFFVSWRSPRLDLKELFPFITQSSFHILREIKELQ